VTRVVLDTNVLISAIMYGGNPRRVLEAVISGSIQMSVSEDLIQELGRMDPKAPALPPLEAMEAREGPLQGTKK
jgi:predicted nucleic acid-binding protein